MSARVWQQEQEREAVELNEELDEAGRHAETWPYTRSAAYVGECRACGHPLQSQQFDGLCDGCAAPEELERRRVLSFKRQVKRLHVQTALMLREQAESAGRRGDKHLAATFKRRAEHWESLAEVE
jgi:hypothetical protein